jgi:ACS family glucarate transporter-like MFS transporter
MDRAWEKKLVVLGLFFLSLILYIDRVCISTAKTAVASDLLLTDTMMGVVFSIFSLGYALGQVPAGWFADRVGPRIALAAVVIAWSVFTGLTGTARSYAVLVVVRFLFGLGEAGCFPGAARVFYNWLPVSERGTANGVMFSGARIGAALSYLFLPGILARFTWRPTFLALGGIGVLWGLLWLFLFRDYPEKRIVQPPEPSVQGKPVSFGKTFTSVPMLLAMLQYFMSNFTFFLGLSWMLPYLQNRYHLTAAQAGHYAMVPFLFAATSLWVTGFLVDRIYASRFYRWSRRFPSMLGFFLAAAGLLCLTRAETPDLAVLFLTLAIYGVEMTVPPSWTHCVDIAGKNAGAVSGSMNAVGNLGSFLSAITFPFLYKWSGSPSAYFYLAAAMNAVGLVAWIGMQPTGGLQKTGAAGH